MKLWDRQARLIIGNKMYKSDDIDIEFNVPFSTEKEPDMSEISIFNLSPESISAIKKGTTVVLMAGYKDDIGMLCSGQVGKFSTTIENVDKKTTIKVASAIIPWQQEKIHKTYAENTTSRDIMTDLISIFGVSIGEMTLVKNVTYAKGRTVSGRLQDVIKSIARETESKFYIDKDRAYVRPYDKGTQTGFLLSSETGLLGSPEKMEISEGDKKSKQGWKVKCLLNHNIAVDSIITLESKTISGIFRVVKGAHTSEWITEMEVI